MENRMAVTITIEFTDAQWEKVLKDFPVFNTEEKSWTDCKSEADYLAEIKKLTNERMQDNIEEKERIATRKKLAESDLFS